MPEISHMIYPSSREMDMTKQEARTELRNLLDKFIFTSRSQRIRAELSDTIVACYVAGHLSREEYQAAMQEVA
jgi:hypothetical protein